MEMDVNMWKYQAILAPALFAGYVLAAAPDNTAPTRNAGGLQSTAGTLLLAQAEGPGLQGQEQQLLSQIQADDAKLKADEAAEQAHPRRVNPQAKYIRKAILRLSEAAEILRDTTKGYQGHRAEALKAMAEAHSQLMQCYLIDQQKAGPL